MVFLSDPSFETELAEVSFQQIKMIHTKFPQDVRIF